MAGLGRKTFSPGDVLTSSDVQGYLMDQSVMVFAGTAARASAIPSPSAGMVAYSTATALQVYDGSAWVDLSTGYGVATGGASSTAISVGGTAYTLLTFTSSSTLTITKSGIFDLFIVSGGGGSGAAGGNGNSGAGGGGASALIQTTAYLSANQTVTIGAGGAVTSLGSPSRVGSSVSLGGGSSTSSTAGGAGGCGSGGGSTTGGVAFFSNLGFNGGDSGQAGSCGAGGGGGGGGAGSTGGGVNGPGGAGGTQFDASAWRGETALTTKYMGGGGGGSGFGNVGGAGQAGGGGNGSSYTGAVAATAGAANTGSGGGGASTNGAGAAGGSGIVLVRFKI